MEINVKMENDDGQFVYTIHGVKVSFPCKAYPTQLSMMNMVRFESTSYMAPTFEKVANDARLCVWFTDH